jgi:hydrogenase maturation factor HypE
LQSFAPLESITQGGTSRLNSRKHSVTDGLRGGLRAAAASLRDTALLEMNIELQEEIR